MFKDKTAWVSREELLSCLTITSLINQWCRIMTPDRSGHFNSDVLSVCVTFCLMLCVDFFFQNVFKLLNASNKHKKNLSTVHVLQTCD